MVPLQQHFTQHYQQHGCSGITGRLSPTPQTHPTQASGNQWQTHLWRHTHPQHHPHAARPTSSHSDHSVAEHTLQKYIHTQYTVHSTCMGCSGAHHRDAFVCGCALQDCSLRHSWWSPYVDIYTRCWLTATLCSVLYWLRGQQKPVLTCIDLMSRSSSCLCLAVE